MLCQGIKAAILASELIPNNWIRYASTNAIAKEHGFNYSITNARVQILAISDANLAARICFELKCSPV